MNNKEQIKNLVNTALCKVDTAELSEFKQTLKIRAVIEMIIGTIDEEAADTIIKTCNEFVKVIKN